jgi:hypothetical protein
MRKYELTLNVSRYLTEKAVISAMAKRAGPSDGLAASLSSKVYVRTTRRGTVQKIVREVYLRQDIPCSSTLCTLCPQSVPQDSRHKGSVICSE